MKEAVTAIQVWHLCDPVQVSSPPRASVVNSRIVTPQTCIPQRAWHKQQLVTDAQESKVLSVFHVSPISFPNLMTKHLSIQQKSKTLPSRINTKETHIQTNQTQSVKLLFSCQVMSDSF